MPKNATHSFRACRNREDIYFFGRNDPKLLRKIAELMNAIAKEHFTGISKPEPLRVIYKAFGAGE